MKKKSLLFMLLFALLAPWTAQAQEIVEIGTDGGTTTSNYLPAYTFYNNTLSEQIYTAEEVTMAGTITSIAFYNGGSTKSPEIKIYMVNTNQSEFSSTTAWLNVTANDLVFENATVTFTANAWTTIELNTPFEYDGTSNLGIIVDEHMTWSSGLACRVFTSTSNCSMYVYGDNTDYNAVTPPTSYGSSDYNGRLSVKNQLKLGIIPGEGPCCPKPKVTVDEVTSNSVTFHWDGNGECQYTVFNATTNTQVFSESGIVNPKTITGLSPLTDYRLVVKAVCSDCENIFSEAVTKTFTTTAVAEEVGDAWADDFEGASCGWGLINGSCTNIWAWGTATNNGGSHGLYVSNDNGATNAYSNNDAAIVYATKLLHFTEGKFEFSYDWNAKGESNYDYIRVWLAPASATFTAGQLPSGSTSMSGYTNTTPTGWIALGGKLNLADAWQTETMATNVATGNYYMVFMWGNDGSGGSNPPAAVDNVSISRVTCAYDVDSLAVANITTNSATLTWTAGEASQWQVAYANNASFNNPTEVIVSAATYNMTGLQHSTTYYAKVRAYCGGNDFGTWSNVISFPTECEAITEYPYIENFDSYPGVTNGTTNNLPICWNYINTTTYSSNIGYPVVYNNSSYSFSGNNNLKFLTNYSSYGNYDPQDQYAILPAMENLNGKQLTIYARGYNANSTFKVGMMTDPTDVSTFVEIATTTPSTSYEEYTYQLTGTGNYVAIMVEAANSTVTSRTVYIDDIRIDFPPTCPKPTDLAVTSGSITAHQATITWTENGEATEWHVEFATNANFDNYLYQPVYDEPTLSFVGLEAETTYYVRVLAHCGPGDESLYSNVVSFTTAPACVAPTSLTCTGVTATTATLSWTDTGESTAWEIVLNLNDTIQVTENPYTFNNLITENVYTAKLRGICHGAYTGWSNEVSFQPTAKLVIGSGTSTSSSLPCNNYYKYSLTEQIYTVAELGEAGLIESIDFYKNSTTEMARSLNIYMVSTDKDQFNSTSDWIIVTAEDLVYSGTVTFLNNAWTTIVLDEGFVYDGEHNMAIIVDDNTGSYESTTYFRTFSTPDQYQALYHQSDGTNYDPTGTPDNASSRLTSKNQIRLMKSELSDCMKPMHLTATEVGPDYATLQWNEYGTSQEWVIRLFSESYPNGEVLNATTNPFTLTGLSPETEYVVIVRPVCGADVWSSFISFTTLEACPMPSDLEVTNLLHNSATVSWSGYSDSYNITYGWYTQTPTTTVDFENNTIPAAWVNDSIHPWIVTQTDGTWCMRSGNQGIGNSSSSISITANFNLWSYISFDAKCMGEGSGNYIYDLCSFYIDDSLKFTKGANGDFWESYFYDELIGTHTFTWVYTKDGSVDNPGDGFFVDNVVIGTTNLQWGTPIEGLTETTYDFTGLLANTRYLVLVEATCDPDAVNEISFLTLSPNYKVFLTEGNWDEANNWSPAGVPTLNQIVELRANATIPSGYVAEAAKIVFAGTPEPTLTLDDDEDGPAQLKTNNNVKATVKKHITGYGPDNNTQNDYYLITTPMVSSHTPTTAGLITSIDDNPTYDLYKWGRTSELEEWQNYKKNTFNLANGTGYLYANQNTVDLTFTGNIRANNANITMTPSYTEETENGWNLYGNPFVCEAYLTSDTDAMAFYILEREHFEATTDPIAPMEGVFVHTPASGKTVTFSRTAPAKQGQLNMTLNQGDSQKDNIIIRFGEGNTLRKLNFFENRSKLFIAMEGQDYAVVNADKSGEMPVSFKAEEDGTFTLHFCGEDVTFSYLRLVDTQTNTGVDLLAQPEYTFSAKAGEDSSRFIIVYEVK